jgi:NAD(P)-dependent dehydrogenase (short-subunit alcohol dehydrogenase family)
LLALWSVGSDDYAPQVHSVRKIGNGRVRWTAADVPDQTGRVAVITGGNAGIGFETATVLANKGAHVVLAARDLDKGKQAAARICATSPSADVGVRELDLASLKSVCEAAEALNSTYPRIDLLINNAGVMFTREGCTQEGFELQFATNHLGHFALTGLLLDNLLSAPASRVVTISSLAHSARGSANFDDVRRPYHRMAAYGRSKLANLLFTYELQRRLTAKGLATMAVAAHPGISRTGLFRNSPGWLRIGSQVLAPLMSQSPKMGALPTLRAATDSDVRGGQYYGPGGLAEQRGYPKAVRSSAASHDEGLALKVWKASEELTGIIYPL